MDPPTPDITGDPKVARVVDAGRERGIDVAPRAFAAGTRTAADAAAQVGCDVAQIVKSLVFDSDSGPLLFLVSGANRVDVAAAARLAGVSEVRKADADSVKAATGFSIGATPPFGHASDVPVFMDEDLLTHAEVWAAGGRPDTVFPVDPHQLMRATNAAVGTLRDEAAL